MEYVFDEPVWPDEGAKAIRGEQTTLPLLTIDCGGSDDVKSSAKITTVNVRKNGDDSDQKDRGLSIYGYKFDAHAVSSLLGKSVEEVNEDLKDTDDPRYDDIRNGLLDMCYTITMKKKYGRKWTETK
jgi:hypothetical protein